MQQPGPRGFARPPHELRTALHAFQEKALQKFSKVL